LRFFFEVVMCPWVCLAKWLVAGCANMASVSLRECYVRVNCAGWFASLR
jgi:hypothetical protein